MDRTARRARVQWRIPSGGLGFVWEDDEDFLVQLEGDSIEMHTILRSTSPTILLRITDGTYHMHRAFNDFTQAVKSAEAFAGAGFAVDLVSATGQFLMGFQPRTHRLAI
jgi:hypothetical protein